MNRQTEIPLPNIVGVLGNRALGVRFFRPSVGAKTLEPIIPESTVRGYSEAVSRIVIRPNEAVPFHAHALQHVVHKEYHFDPLGPSEVVVLFVDEGGYLQEHVLSASNRRVYVSPGLPHALFCPPSARAGESGRGLVVIKSALSVQTPPRWEKEADALIARDTLSLL